MHEVLVEHKLQREVAAAHKITAARVCSLCKRAEKNKSFLKDMVDLRERKERRRRKIERKVVEMNQDNLFVDSAAYV